MFFIESHDSSGLYWSNITFPRATKKLTITSLPITEIEIIKAFSELTYHELLNIKSHLDDEIEKHRDRLDGDIK